MTITDQITYYAQHTEADPTRRSYSIGDQAAGEVVRLAKSAGRVAVDIETMGLGELAFKIKVIIIATSQRSCVLDASDARHCAAAREAIGAARELVFHNCLSGDTRVVTRAGERTLAELAGTYAELWDGREWTKSEVKAYGTAPVSEIEFGLTKSRSALRETHRATANHRWVLRDGTIRTTSELQVGDVVPASVPTVEIDKTSDAFRHGLMFADGTFCRVRKRDGRFSHQLRLCGWKAKYSHLFDSITYPATYSGDPMAYHHAEVNYKEFPRTTDPEYLASFIAGWVEFDGSQKVPQGVATTTARLSTSSPEHVEWLRRHGPSAGWIVTGQTTAVHGPASYGPGTTYEKVSLAPTDQGRFWTIKSIRRDVAVEPVYCPEVPTTHQFTLASGIRTMNSSFDVPPLIHAGIMRISDIDKIYDTIIYSRMAFTKEMDRHALGALEKKFLSGRLRSASKDALAEWAKTNRMTKGKVFEVAQYSDPVYAMYAGWDGILTSLVLDPVRDAARHQLTNHPFGRYGADAVQAEYLMEREQRVNRIMLRRSARGIRLDDERVAHEQDRLRVERLELAEQLKEFGIEEATNRGHLAKALEEAGAFGEDYPRTEKTGRPSTQAKHLEMLDHPAVTAFKAYDDRRRLFTYLENARLVAERTDGRIHPQVNIHKARTGRSSYDNPALQQFTTSARQILMADEGDSLVSIDWASIEPVTAANIAGDTTLIERFEAGEKIYNVVSEMAGVSYKKAKVVVLAKMYAQGIRSLAAGLKTTPEEAQELQHKVALSMPRTDRFVRWAAAWSEEYGKTWTMSGRIIDVDPEFGYKGSNFVVQGSAYDVLSESLVAVDEAGLADGLYLSVHDELVVSESVAHDVRQIMETPPERLIELSGRVPKLRTDAALLGDRWNDSDDCPAWPTTES